MNLWWIFITTTIIIVYNCITWIIWISLIFLFLVIYDSNSDTFVWTFCNFYTEFVLLVIGDFLVEDEMCVWATFTDILEHILVYFEFWMECLLEAYHNFYRWNNIGNMTTKTQFLFQPLNLQIRIIFLRSWKILSHLLHFFFQLRNNLPKLYPININLLLHQLMINFKLLLSNINFFLQQSYLFPWIM